MNQQIPNDPFSGIQLPRLTQVTQISDSMGEQSVPVQIATDRTDLPVFSGSDKTTKRPMRPPADTVSDDVNSATEAFIGDPIDVVGSDGKLNKVAKHGTWVTPTNYPTFLKTSTSGKTITLDSNGLEIYNGSQTISLFFSAFSNNMSIKEIDVCDGGVNKKMLILASDPY